MYRFNWFSSVFLFLLLSACGKPLPSLDNLDLDAWKADLNGCSGKRIEMQQVILEQKDKLLALDEKQLIKLLGRPDQNELYKRNQKFYTYFISPAPSCDTPSSGSVRLIVRFNAMGLANEITVN